MKENVTMPELVLHVLFTQEKLHIKIVITFLIFAITGASINMAKGTLADVVKEP